MRLRLLVISLFFFATAGAQNLVIYPLNSQDTLLGVAVADQLERAFEAELEVFGPAVSSTLVSPLVVEDGFFSLLRLASNIDTPEGSSLSRGLLGADYVLTGRINFTNSQLEARYFLATPEGQVERFLVSAPEDDPALLVTRSVMRLAARLGMSTPSYEAELDLSSPYLEYIQAVALIGFGQIVEAASVLDSLDNRSAEAQALFDDLQAVQVGTEGSNAALMATMSLSNTPVDESLSSRYFEAFAQESSLPVADIWYATLLSSLEDEQASAAFEAAASYPYGAASQIAYQQTQGEAYNSAELLAQDEFASLLAAAFIAQTQEDNETEKLALRKITELEPSFVYPFERLSFIAFDEDDALSAGQALAVATRLEPDSDLYWTNLGWSYYLLGILDKSEEASIRATVLNPAQNIAFFNLGLVRVTTGRLAEAMDAYASAIALDPEVDDEAVLDLVNALELYPTQKGIHYALASLYEQEGQNDKAKEQFELYLASETEAPFERFAQQRLNVLNAPPARIEISEGIELGLGSRFLETSSIQAGDRLYSAFELFTPDSELPKEVTASLSLVNAAGELIAEQSQIIDIPTGVIGYVIDSLNIDIPQAPAGTYTLEFSVFASDDREASQILVLDLEGEASLTRQLISRAIIMEDLETSTALYSESDLNAPDDELIQALLNELQLTASIAEEALPVIESGRFEGLGGEELFLNSTAQDILDFLRQFLESDAGDARFSFAEAYAQWALTDAE